MLVFGIGLSASQLDEDLGFIVTTVGAVLALIGVVMIWMRSRMKGKR